jgi:uncharacterized metal-binding protein YceD (DUF177 family)
MKIEFRKIDRNLVPFNLKKGNLSFDGNLKKLKFGLIECQAAINGTLETQCIRCAKEFSRVIDEELTLKISDGIIESSNDLDIIEMEDGVVDLDLVLDSEIEAYQCEYNICDECKDIEINYEG